MVKNHLLSGLLLVLLGTSLFATSLNKQDNYSSNLFNQNAKHCVQRAANHVTKKIVYVSPTGVETNSGSKDSPLDIVSACANATKNETIILLGGTYELDQVVLLSPSNSATYNEPSYLEPEVGAKVVLDFAGQGCESTARGIELEASYWRIRDLEVKNAGDNGIYVGGNYNIVENCLVHNCRDTGIQLGRNSSQNATIDTWPSNNLIKNCTSFDNQDPTGENADGFAVKLTVGENNVLDGCMSYNNVDDGYDLYAKPETGSIGTVVIKNSVAFNNGGTTDNITTPKSDGNGFKLGGSAIKGTVIIENCMTWNNMTTGITDNSNPGVIIAKNITSFDNGTREEEKSNIALARTESTSYNSYSYVISVRTNKDISEDDYLGSMDHIIGYVDGRYWKVDDSIEGNSRDASKRGNTYKMPDDVFLKTELSGDLKDYHNLYRNSDGSLNFGEFLKINDTKHKELKGYGADLSKTSYDPVQEFAVPVENENSDAEDVRLVYDALTESFPENVYRDINFLNKFKGCSIAWSSSDPAIKIDHSYNTSNPHIIANFATKGVVTRGEEDKEVTLTAKIFKNNAVRKKTFKVTVKKADSGLSADSFIERFNYESGEALPCNKKTGWTAVSNPSTKIVNEVLNHKSISDEYALQLKSSSSDTKLTRAINLDKKKAIEAYITTQNMFSGISIDILNDSNVSLGGIKLQNNNFTVKLDGNNEIDPDISYTNDVWQRVRIEIDPSNNLLSAYYFDYSSNSFKNLGEGNIQGQGTKLGIITLKGSTSSNSYGYLSHLVFDDVDSSSFDSNYNPNKQKGFGIATITPSTTSFDKIIKVAQNSDEFIKPTFSFTNRFTGEVMVENLDYTYTYDNGGFDISKNDAYYMTYTFQIIGDSEKVVYSQIIVVDNGEINLKNISCSVISQEGEVKFSGEASYDKGTVYYIAVEANSIEPTAEQVIAQQNYGPEVKANGTVQMNEGSLNFNGVAIGLDHTKFYDFYFVATNTTNENNIILSKKNIGEVYLISTPEEFYDMATNNDTASGKFKIANDINFSGFNWVVNSDAKFIFKGELDGNGHIIKNLKMNSSYERTAIFRNTKLAVIKNIIFEDCTVTTTGMYAGLLAAKVAGGTYSDISLYRCSVNSVNQYCGLLFGRAESSDTTNLPRTELIMKNIIDDECIVCSNSDTGSKYTGGLLAAVEHKNLTITVDNVYSNMTVYAGAESAGCIIGRIKSFDSTIINISNVVSNYVIHGYKKCGGIIGKVEGSLEGTFNIKNVFSHGIIVLAAVEVGTSNDLIGYILHDSNNANQYVFNLEKTASYNFFMDFDNIPKNESQQRGVTCQVVVSSKQIATQQWYEENAGLKFESNSLWKYNGEDGTIVVNN